MKEIDNKKIVEIGDKICCQGYTFTVSEIHSQDYWGDFDKDNPNKDWGIFLEFRDKNNRYHYWKQYIDGGDIIPKEPGRTIHISEELEKRILDFCKDELEYHICESGCAEQYHSEILAQIELLKLLEDHSTAECYTDAYHNYLQENYEDIDFELCSEEAKEYCEKNNIGEFDLEKDEEINR